MVWGKKRVGFSSTKVIQKGEVLYDYSIRGELWMVPAEKASMQLSKKFSLESYRN